MWKSAVVMIFNNIPVFTYNKYLFWDLPGRTPCKTTTYFSRKSAASLKLGIFRTRSRNTGHSTWHQIT